MEKSGDKDQGKKKVYEVTTFPVPYSLGEIKENITVNTNTSSTPSKDQIINKAFNFHSQGNISEAAKLYQYCINQGFKDYRVFANYGVISQGLSKLQDAESYTRKAIELKPNYADSYYNLAIILVNLGKLKDAEFLFRKAIEIKPDFASAYWNLSGFNSIDFEKLISASSNLPRSFNKFPRLECASAKSGFSSIALSNEISASFNFPVPCKIPA